MASHRQSRDGPASTRSPNPIKRRVIRQRQPQESQAVKDETCQHCENSGPAATSANRSSRTERKFPLQNTRTQHESFTPASTAIHTPMIATHGCDHTKSPASSRKILREEYRSRTPDRDGNARTQSERTPHRSPIRDRNNSRRDGVPKRYEARVREK